jgi:antitoxin (DNA-binding transcriptional repressor) of toxin-antitoxin stability system
VIIKESYDVIMKAITVTEAETNFPDVLLQVKNGEKFKILSGNHEEAVAMIIPFANDAVSRKIGILNGKAKFEMKGNGKISEKEFFGL